MPLPRAEFVSLNTLSACMFVLVGLARLRISKKKETSAALSATAFVAIALALVGLVAVISHGPIPLAALPATFFLIMHVCEVLRIHNTTPDRTVRDGAVCVVCAALVGVVLFAAIDAHERHQASSNDAMNDALASESAEQEG